MSTSSDPEDDSSGVVIGVDLGTVRIGISHSDSRRILAHPYGVIERTKDDVQAAKRIGAVVEDLDGRLIVVGLPIDLRGKRGVAAQQVESFLDCLHEQVNVRIETVDERMTSVVANRQRNEVSDLISVARRREKGDRRALRRSSRRPVRPVIDDQAATIILQGYLDSHRGVQ